MNSCMYFFCVYIVYCVIVIVIVQVKEDILVELGPEVYQVHLDPQDPEADLEREAFMVVQESLETQECLVTKVSLCIPNCGL